jgi:hypothetical protein
MLNGYFSNNLTCDWHLIKLKIVTFQLPLVDPYMGFMRVCSKKLHMQSCFAK